MGSPASVLSHLTTAAQALSKAFAEVADPVAAEIIGRASVFTGSAIEQVIHPIDVHGGGQKARTAPYHADYDLGGGEAGAA